MLNGLSTDSQILVFSLHSIRKYVFIAAYALEKLADLMAEFQTEHAMCIFYFSKLLGETSECETFPV
jgi:hypothetical protein